jgi:hypothetical protein
MANGDPIIIGLPNTASNPGTATILSRDENTAETVFVARNLNIGDGIRGEASDDAYGGVRGINTIGTGVRGESDTSYGVWGGSNGGTGVRGRSNDSDGVSGTSSSGTGVSGTSFAGGTGVRGSSSGGPNTYGVVGHREGSGFGAGVQGSSNNVMGVVGFSRFYPAVYGNAGFIDPVTQEEVGATGTAGTSFGRGGIGVSGRGGMMGIYGLGSISDQTEPTAGVVGEVVSGAYLSPGVVGRSSRGPGVLGEAEPAPQGGHRPPHPGIRGTSETGAAGVEGRNFGPGAGVLGLGQTGVLGISGQGDAGEFYGDVRVHGILYKDGGGFRIDHPQTPEDKYLTHSFVESDDMKNVYDGAAILDESGAASVDLPEWFEGLNRDFRYQLTAVGGAAPNLHVAEEVSGNRFKIAGGEEGMKVCWQVTGIRQDPWADANRIEVEEDKAEGERGYYLHPDLYEQPEEQGIGFAAFPDEMRQIKQLEEGQLPELPSVLDDPRLEEQRQQIEELRRQFPPPSEE